MKIVIIGAVAAGLKAASKARRTDSKAEITVIEKGSQISYGACGLPYYAGGEVNDLSALSRTAAGLLRDPEYFRDVKNINVLIRTEAIAIDRQMKNVRTKNLQTGAESELPYDKLVIATGAYPIKPDLPGSGLANILTFWHPDEAKVIRQGLEKGQYKNAVIIGAGLVGMEMAAALANWGINITVVEMREHIFPSSLDVEMAAMAENYLREEGIDILTSERVMEFTGDSSVAAVRTDKRTITADLVIMSLGVRPNSELARAAGLEIGDTGAITVNHELQTSDPDIFAGGDCVENLNIVTQKKVFAPMGSTANKHGRIIGENLFGGNAQFRGILGTAVVKILDFNVGKTGVTEREARELGFDYLTVTTAGQDKPHYMEGSKLIAIKLIADPVTRRILGVQVVGEGDVSKRLDVAASILTFGGTIDDLFDIDLSYAPPFNSPIDALAVAANVMMNKLKGRFSSVTSLKAKDLMVDDKTVFLDVRTPNEVSKKQLSGCGNVRHIPLSELRKRCSELGKDDKVITFCKLGLRGYEAAAMLEGADFSDVQVLEGGLYTWPFGCEKE
jgi:NADPH-dependent 2,4-dienoyl-CoA reductase/sulfur reductase-like enzyme/rhodanese-related sulfurtransferase